MKKEVQILLRTVLTLERLRQEDRCWIKASLLLYIMSSRPARATP